mmetsp:Transcript_77997/g.252186  ORF Transcript_77997/g.252186 Transcript_77997/m.252186 type:complete len:440 (-) Transcript_77997:266-1585(-)
MPMKLYAHPDNYKTKKALICAKYAGLEIETPKGGAADQTGRVPVLETEQGCIFSSAAIARYISRINRCTALYGQNLLEGGMIDSWVEFCTHELEVPLCAWVLPVQGVFPEVPEATKCAKEDVKSAMTVLNNHLLANTYMVGHTITLADVSLFCALLDGMSLVLDDAFRKPFGNVMRWFTLCLAQPEFKAVVGDVKLCGGGAAGAAKADKKEAKPTTQEEKLKQEDKPKTVKPKSEPKPKGEAKQDKKEKEQDETKKDEKPAVDPVKKKKAVIKEGGKRGVEIEGAADMGGLQFFCTSVDEPEGDIELLLESVKAMNEKSDPTDEERKGGSGHVGKMVFSAGIDQLAMVAYVAEEKQAECSCQEWLEKVLSLFGGKLVSSSKDYCQGVIATDSNKNIFPLKIRESLILEANNFLRKKGLFPEDNGDDDDEMVFGDDDFPS